MKCKSYTLASAEVQTYLRICSSAGMTDMPVGKRWSERRSRCLIDHTTCDGFLLHVQVPLVMLTENVRKRLNRDEAGNIVFWLTFCVVGQPFCVLMYTHDYYYATHTMPGMGPAT